MDHGDIFNFERDLGTLYGEVTREQYPKAEAERCECEGVHSSKIMNTGTHVDYILAILREQD